MTYIKIGEIAAGQTIIADGGFTCMPPGPKVVEAERGELFVRCRCGRHFLEGQVEDECGTMIGFSAAASEPAAVAQG